MKPRAKTRKARLVKVRVVKGDDGLWHFRNWEKVKQVSTLSESALQIAVVEHLRLTGVPGLLFFKIPNEGKRTQANGARMKAEGLLPGVADLFVKTDSGVPLFLELKAKGKQPTAAQIMFRSAAIIADCLCYSADNIDDALQILRNYGAIRSRK